MPAGETDPLRVVCLAPPDSTVGARRGEPVTCGVPWPSGRLTDVDRLRLLDAAGAPLPLQARALDLWPDGSIRWTLLDFRADVGDGAATYTVEVADTTPTTPSTPLRWSTEGQALTVETGRARITFAPGRHCPFANVVVGGRERVGPGASCLRATDGTGRELHAVIDDVELEASGPVRVAVRLSGRLLDDRGSALLAVGARCHLFVDTAVAKLELAVHNPRAAGHPGNRWSLGSAGSVYLEELSLVIAPQLGGEDAVVSGSAAPGVDTLGGLRTFELYQDSSGGTNWRSTNHVNRDGAVPTRFRGYRLVADEASSTGERATPVVSLEGASGSVSIAMQQFWQNFPKAVEGGDGALSCGLFPGAFADHHEIQGGERKTHLLHLALDDDDISSLPLDWCRQPLLARAEPRWYARSGALPGLVPAAEDPNADYLALIDTALDAVDGFEAKRERIDEYGWRHFGDLWADHETIYHDGPAPLVSHYNNQYDALAGFIVHFLRTGERGWWELADDLARHVVDIDVYHTDLDRAAYNGGQFWHTDHYTDAWTSTHRGSPRLPGVAGGGPSPGHLYTTGLMLHHFLTGSPVAADTVVDLGRYVVRCEDGRRSRYRWWSRQPTGTASESGFDAYHGPGRTPGNAINALLDAHRLSGDPALLDHATVLVRRCVHPHDDLDARNLGDAEHRWFYTVFMVSLLKYLDTLSELDRRDGDWEYAHAALLHYGRWAARHEYPYLERPEILDFPTETWAAQDMRKSEMFRGLARYTGGDERALLLERARFFFDVSLRQLERLETRSFCRPLVLLLVLGHGQAWFDRRPLLDEPAAESPPGDWGEPPRFVPQKQRAIRRAAMLAALTAAAAAALWLAWIGR